jgi:gliding motility-associated-like protein
MGDGNTSLLPNPAYQFTTPGIYYPKLVVTTSNGCTDSITTTQAIKVVASPKISIGYSGNTCAPLTAQFTAQIQVPDTSAITWQWNFANGNTSVASNPVAQLYPLAGVYNVTLTGTNSTGCKTTVTIPAESYAIPVVSAGADTLLCKGSSITLKATGADTYVWSPAANLSCTNCASPATNTPDDKTYYVTGSSIHGCSAKDTILVRVKTKFVLIHSASDSVCKGQTKKITAAGAYSYVWSPAASLDNANIASPTAMPDITTQYTVIATDDRGCFKDTGYVNIKVNPIPTVEAGIDQTINVGKSIDLVPTISADVSDVNWQPTTGIFRNFWPGVTVKPKENTEYTVEVKNRGGCKARDRVTVFVICNGSNIFIPNTFSPNADGTNDIFYARGTGLFKIRNIKIFNRWGEVVFDRSSFDANNPAYGWDGTNKGVPLNADVFVYSMEVLCDNGSVLTYRGNIALIR